MIVRRGGGWVWFFAVLTVLCIVAVSILIIFNKGQQLTAEVVESARKRWEKNGLKSYILRYKRKVQSANIQFEHAIIVKVKNGNVKSLTIDGIPKGEKQFAFYGVDVLFDEIDAFFIHDKKETKRRIFVRGVFDEHNGHLKYFVRRVGSSRTRTEIIVESLEKW